MKIVRLQRLMGVVPATAAMMWSVFVPQISLANELSLDISVSAVTLADDADVLTSTGLVTSFPGVPPGADLIAYHREANGDQLFALDTTVVLPGDEFAFPGDVMRYDGAEYSNVWRASSEGLQSGVMTDAISKIGDQLVLSFDTTVNLAGVIADDEDLVLITPGGPQMLFDGSAQGLNPATDLDAASYYDGQGGLIYLSFDTSGQVSGLNFADEDVLEFRISDGQWQMHSSGAANIAAADLDAFQVVFTLFQDGFESGL